MPDDRATVLLVDDDDVLTMSLAAVLERAGYQATVASAAEDPTFEPSLASCDVLVVDLEIPGGASGFEIVEQVRARAHYRDLPILMLTAHNPISYRLKGLRLGADDYLAKPIDPQELLLRVDALLRRARAGQADRWKIPARRADRSSVALDIREITHIEAQRGFCFAYAGPSRYILNRTMAELESEIPVPFIRAHRSFLVNPSHIVALRPRSAWLSELVLDDGAATRVPVSKSLLAEVRARTEL